MTEFGVQLHGTFPMGRYPELARIVESHGFRELTVHDIVWWRPVWPILTLLAASTERVLVGPDVTHPYLRHPVDTATNVAALDELSGGRAILGLGTGSMLAPLGIEVTRPLAAVRECAELVRQILRRERAPYEGQVFSVSEEAQLFWEPPRPSVPMFVGAFGPRMVEAASAWANELRSPAIWAPAFFCDLKRRAEAAAVSAANDGFRVGCDVWLSLADERDEARALGRRMLAQFIAVPHMQLMHEFHGLDAGEVADVTQRFRAGDLDGAAAAISDRTLDTYVAAGNAADVARGLERLIADGAPASVTFSGRIGPDPIRALELLAGRVLREVR